MSHLFAIVVGYIRETDTLLKDKIVPPDIIYIINYYYRCKEFTIPVCSDESSSSTEDELTSSDSEQHYSTSTESNSNNKQQWTKEELYGRYLPIKESCRDDHSVVFEGISTWNSKSIGIKVDAKVSIKKIHGVFNTDTGKQMFKEWKILHTLSSHKSIIKLFDILPPIDPATFQTLTTIYEYTDTNLSQIFTTNQYFSSFQIEYILYGILHGINYIHSKQIVHCNLQPSNILINKDFSVKICDFGLAHGFNETFFWKKQIEKSHAYEKYRKKPFGFGKHNKECVISSAYTPPEIILHDAQQYLPQIDMWNVGCIFGELLQMQKENCSTFWKRGPLFPSRSSFPPACYWKRSKIKTNVDHLSLCQIDAMKEIFRVLGTPTKEEIESFNDEKVRTYLKNLPEQKFKWQPPGMTEDGVNLLRYLLKFDAQKRLNVFQALNHSYFNRVKDIDSIGLHCNYSRTKWEGVQLTMTKLECRRKILNEVLYYHPDERIRFEQSGILPPIKNMKSTLNKIVN